MLKYICFVLIFVSLVTANLLYDLSRDDFNKLKDSRNFTGKVVLVTGSNSGIGEGIVKLFSYLEAQVVVTGRNAVTIKTVAQEVQELSPKKLKPLEVIADVTKNDDLERLIKETIKTYGKLDVLVNNASIAPLGSIRDNNFMQNYDTVFNTNLRPAAELNHLSVPYLMKTNGSITHISSISGIAPHQNSAIFSMTKAGMDMMTKCLALELGHLGIRVNSVNPGLTLTQAMKNYTDTKLFKRMTQQIPLKRVGQVLDVAKGVVFLSSSEASFITGANLVIDGGLIHNYFNSDFFTQN